MCIYKETSNNFQIVLMFNAQMIEVDSVADQLKLKSWKTKERESINKISVHPTIVKALKLLSRKM